MRTVKAKWRRKRWGLKLGATRWITNLRFADDVLLIGTSLHQVRNMLQDVRAAARERGLELHPDKTKILSNATLRTGRPKATSTSIDDMDIGIVPLSGAWKYLGRQISFFNTHETEIDHRISTAWKKFHVHRAELTGKQYSINSRLRLFESTVSATMLYGCETWCLTKPLEDKIRRTQRRMLRMMVHTPRRRVNADQSQNASSDTSTSSSSSDSSRCSTQVSLEPWVDWVRRATRNAEQHLQRLHISDWVTAHRSAACNWLQRLQRPGNSWAHWALQWSPSEPHHRRRHGGQKKRWHEYVVNSLI